jgi:hypothetical protein
MHPSNTSGQKIRNNFALADTRKITLFLLITQFKIPAPIVTEPLLSLPMWTMASKLGCLLKASQCKLIFKIKLLTLCHN